MTEERWLPVVGFEGLYEVSNRGRVRSIDRYVDLIGRWGTKERRFYKGKIRAQCSGGTSDYRMVVLFRQSQKETFTVHTLVLAAFVGPCPAGMEGRHLNCNAHDNSAENLCYGTRHINREDSRKAGTLALGERIAQHKLTEKEVLEIRMLQGRHEDIATAFNVSRAQISRIKRRENWSHV